MLFLNEKLRKKRNEDSLTSNQNRRQEGNKQIVWRHGRMKKEHPRRRHSRCAQQVQRPGVLREPDVFRDLAEAPVTQVEGRDWPCGASEATVSKGHYSETNVMPSRPLSRGRRHGVNTCKGHESHK